MNEASRSFAIIPACGESRRMGTDKLLLPWNDSTILETVIHAWLNSRVDHVFVVVPQERDDLQKVLSDLPVEVVSAYPRPKDMKQSVQWGLRAIESQFVPQADDVWLVAPADMPNLSTEAIDLVLGKAKRHPGSIVVPHQSGKRGHPVLLPWYLAGNAQSLPQDEGLNIFLNRHPFTSVDVNCLGDDIDTPEEYRFRRDCEG